MAKTKPIRVSAETHKRLFKLRNPGETFDSALKRVLDNFENISLPRIVVG